MDIEDKIFIAGHTGMVGGAIYRQLVKKGYRNIVVATRSELDLTQQAQVHRFLQRERPAYVFLAAAKVGGIGANSRYRADFIYQNLAIETNVIHSAYLADIKHLLFLGSSCVYPKHSAQPIKEEYLLSGPFEDTNQPYAVAKLAGIELCQSYNFQHGTDYRAVMPTNAYGPGDRYDRDNSHVIPSLILKMHEAKIRSEPNVTLWGSGSPRREFLYCDDLADGCIFAMNLSREEFYRGRTTQIMNIGYGDDVSIREVAEAVQTVTGFQGTLVWDTSKPDGMLRKLLDSHYIYHAGWRPSIALLDGLEKSYSDFLSRHKTEPLTAQR